MSILWRREVGSERSTTQSKVTLLGNGLAPLSPPILGGMRPTEGSDEHFILILGQCLGLLWG